MLESFHVFTFLFEIFYEYLYKKNIIYVFSLLFTYKIIKFIFIYIIQLLFYNFLILNDFFNLKDKNFIYKIFIFIILFISLFLIFDFFIFYLKLLISKINLIIIQSGAEHNSFKFSYLNLNKKEHMVAFKNIAKDYEYTVIVRGELVNYFFTNKSLFTEREAFIAVIKIACCILGRTQNNPNVQIDNHNKPSHEIFQEHDGIFHFKRIGKGSKIPYAVYNEEDPDNIEFNNKGLQLCLDKENSVIYQGDLPRNLHNSVKHKYYFEKNES